MFEMEKDERIRGLDKTSTALAMAFAHDFILEVLLTREMIDLEAAEATLLSRVLVERWQRRYGDGLAPDSGHSPELKRQLYATKAFVDRLARKALQRSAHQREASGPAVSPAAPEVEVSGAMKQAGATVLKASPDLSPEDLAGEVYKAMAQKS